MTVTDTLATKKAYKAAGFTETQADTMAQLDEQHAHDTADVIRSELHKEFSEIENRISRDLRDQTWRIILFGFAIATIAVTVATFLHR